MSSFEEKEHNRRMDIQDLGKELVIASGCLSEEMVLEQRRKWNNGRECECPKERCSRQQRWKVGLFLIWLMNRKGESVAGVE